jgi:tyrosyl-tRNA synthetase
MLVALGTAPTRTEAERLVKAGAVEIDGARSIDLKWTAAAGTHTIRAGKKWKKIRVAKG